MPEGVEGRVPYKGQRHCDRDSSSWGAALQHGLYGLPDIVEDRAKAEFVEITSAGIRESHVHDVQITKEAPNYHIE